MKTWEAGNKGKERGRRKKLIVTSSLCFFFRSTLEVLLSLLLLLLLGPLFTTNMSTGIGAVFSPVADSEQIPSDSICLTTFEMFVFSTGDLRCSRCGGIGAACYGESTFYEIASPALFVLKLSEKTNSCDATSM